MSREMTSGVLVPGLKILDHMQVTYGDGERMRAVKDCIYKYSRVPAAAPNRS